MIIGDDLSPHFLDDHDGPDYERCELCNRVAVDHDACLVIEGPTATSTEDEEGFTYWGHVACIEKTEGIRVAQPDAWTHSRLTSIKPPALEEVPYGKAEDEPDFDYDEFYGRKGR
jgi:hypothetical protein